MDTFYKLFFLFTIPLIAGSCTNIQGPTIVLMPAHARVAEIQSGVPVITKTEDIQVENSLKFTVSCAKFVPPKLPTNPKLSRADIEAIVSQHPNTYNDQLLGQIEKMSIYIKKTNELWLKAQREHESSCRLAKVIDPAVLN